MLEKFDNRTLIFLGLLLLADIAFMVGHVMLVEGILSDPLFSVKKDRGYPELFQYAKEGLIALIFCYLALRHRQLVFLGWAAMFFYLFADDAFLLHEVWAWDLVREFKIRPAMGLRSLDFGELYVSLIAAVILFSVIAVGHIKSNQAARKISWNLVIMIFFLALFGVGVDTFHRAVSVNDLFRVLLEDSGEMVVMSVILAYVCDLVLSPPDGLNPD